MNAIPFLPGSRGKLPLIRQSEATECGPACVAMLLGYHGHPIDMTTVRRRFPVSLKGTTLKGLMQMAALFRLTCRPLRFELGQLGKLRLPAIVHWDLDHFVVLKAVTPKGIVVHDPASGEKRYPLEEASKHLTGIALEVAPAEGFEAKDERARLPLGGFWERTWGIGAALLQVFALSVLLEALVVAAPFYMQLAVDEVVVKGDADLLVALALGFGLLAAISVASGALRSFILLMVQNLLHLQMSADLFRHLLRLPLSYFEKRHVGDVLSRFGSLEPIRSLVSEGLIAGVIDGTMAAATLAMMFLYSPTLAGVVLAAVGLYAALRLATYRVFRARSEDVIAAHAKEQSTLIETIRAVQGIKLFNREAEREGVWLNRFAAVAGAEIRVGRLRVAFKAANDAVFGLENILVVYLATRLVLAGGGGGGFTVGMLFAFMSLKQHFVGKAVHCVEKALDLRVIQLHLERLADIALSPPEPGHERSLACARPIEGGIEVRDLSFRYGETDPFVLAGMNLKVEPGEYVAIAGPSGTGKTTLGKIVLGLLEATSGEVLVDGVPLSAYGVRAFREQVGAVMQDDQLLSGSIAENICFFDQDFDPAWMVECATMAAIHNDVMRMPMGYDTPVGDMGSALSGGQKQRVLLARALYRRPRILLLDEGTAHLDLETERRISETLRQLPMTRISIAHRPETIQAADRVITLDGR